MQDIDALVENVEGWLNPTEGRVLYRLARQCEGRGAIVEIGSWKGRSTIWLSMGSRAGCRAKVHAIDPHTGSPQHVEMFKTDKFWTFEEFKKNIENAGVKDQVEPHVDFSVSAAKKFNEPVEMIFIDGLHEYEGVKDDFEAWFPKVVDGGWMAFHDSTCFPGVLRVMKEDLFKSRRFRKIRFASSITYGQKVAQNTFMERVGNRVMLGWFLVHAFTDRWSYRIIHSYLDCSLTRSLVSFLKKRAVKRSPVPVQR
jgi:predicted O-methyltransferase YrrM